MAKIEKSQASALKRLMQDDGWSVLEQALENRIKTLQEEEITGNDAFETLRALHKQQGKVEGLKDFFESVERLVFDE